VRPGILELPSTFQTDLVRSIFDSKHTALSAVTTSKHKMENPENGFHKSPARCRRSQLPLASSQSSNARTLARASAIAQSAAP